MKVFTLWIALGFASQAWAADVDCFRARSDGAAFIAVDSPELLATAADRSSKTTSVSFGDRTCVLSVATVNGEKWVFVRGYWIGIDRRPLQGWLPLDVIAYRNKLVRHQNVRVQAVDVEIGDYFAQYAVKKGGAFTVHQSVSEHKCRKSEIPNEYGACEDVVTVHGYFYGKGRLAIAVSEKYGEFDIFKLASDGTLCPWQYGNPPDACR
ncbi:hypothetical protein GTP41_23860 [Pseudoduganella sp. DS3]|uniref:SH3 domain-containing protein n=1 Tax=Pseudoduganella guangdongensis TaxID=2692179 RepID=A0A6N9HPC1_9BURK|nr:hypothetical protein [Pseudoduganella guangdongensis]MYN05137.1 hypothetical protein [Pseudoduganella guangdongensis]